VGGLMDGKMGKIFREWSRWDWNEIK